MIHSLHTYLLLFTYRDGFRNVIFPNNAMLLLRSLQNKYKNISVCTFIVWTIDKTLTWKYTVECNTWVTEIDFWNDDGYHLLSAEQWRKRNPRKSSRDSHPSPFKTYKAIGIQRRALSFSKFRQTLYLYII